MIFGEISTNAHLDFENLVREKIKEIGYDNEEKGLDYKTFEFQMKLNQQSNDIAEGVHLNKNKEDMGAGDQGLMFGYATDETDV